MMKNATTRLCAFAFAVTMVTSGLRAQDEPLPLQPQAHAAVPTPEPAKARPLDAGITRLFFAPTARSLPRGRGSLGLTEIVFPSVDVGLTDRVSLGGVGVPPLEGLSDGGVGLTPKIQVLRHSRVQAAIGAMVQFPAVASGGIGYGVVTLGGTDAAATVGYGYGYGHAADSAGSPGVLFVGADKAIGRSWRLMVEAYIGGAALGLPDQTLIGGARFSRGRWSVELGAVIPIYETGSGLPLPRLQGGVGLLRA